MNRPSITVLLVDDHPVVRDGIAAMLADREDIDVCGLATCGLEALSMAQALRLDLTGLDIGLPDMNGLEATRQLMGLVPDARVVILTVYDNVEYVKRAARIGARGYLVKNSPSAALLEAIETVHDGRLYYPEELHDLVVRELGRRPVEEPIIDPPELSERERQVLSLIADGMSNRDIAERLSLSVRTIETHRERIMDKLDIRTVAGLTKYALAEGLTHLD